MLKIGSPKWTVKRRGQLFVDRSMLLDQFRISIRTLMAIILAFNMATSTSAAEAKEVAKVRPNVLLILVDDLSPLLDVMAIRSQKLQTSTLLPLEE